MNAIQNAWEIESAITNLRVPFKPHDEARMKLHALFEKALQLNCRSGVVVIGDTGTGKTTLIDSVIAAYPRTETEEGSNIPVVYLQLNSEPTMGSILRGLLDVYGIKTKPRDTKSTMFNTLKTLMTECKTKVIIIDDAQHITGNGKCLKSMHKVSDDLKVLADLDILLVMSGISTLLPLFANNRELRRRFSNRIHLRPLPKNEESMELIRSTTNALLAQSESGFQLDIDPEGDDFWTRVYVATNGSIAYINILVAGAAAQALLSGRKKLAKKDFMNAFKEHIFYSATNDTNPFHSAFGFRTLNKEGEPFEDMEVAA